MRLTRRVLLSGVVLLLAGVVVAPLAARAETASQFYVKYRAAFDKAKAIDELFPYMAKATVAEIKGTPAKERAQMFEMIHEVGKVTGLKIVKETATADGATLAAEGLDADKKKTTGTIQILKEDGGWKVGKESWSSGS